MGKVHLFGAFFVKDVQIILTNCEYSITMNVHSCCGTKKI